MPPQRFLLTGGAGLIGSTIVDRLLVEEPGAEIVVYDDLSRGTLANLRAAHEHAGGRLRVEVGDVRDAHHLRAAMTGVDVVFHLAAIRITRCAEDPLLAHEVLGTGTVNVADAAAAAGVRKLVYSSSASVYGLAESFPTREDHHGYDNDTIYGAAKLYGEGVLRSYHATRGLDYVALRYFNVYGPRMDTHGKYTEVLIRWMQAIEQGEPPVIFGDGTTTMDLVFVDDVARANVAAARAAATDVVCNVGTGAETSLRGLADALVRAMGSDVEPVHAPERSVNPVPRRLASVAAAEQLLGFRADVGLDDGLRRLVAWWRAVDRPAIPSGARTPAPPVPAPA